MGYLLLLVLATLPCAAQNLKLYDDFDGKFINPSKWSFGYCFTGNYDLECVREIRDENLHLAHRTFGLSNSNTGQQFGGAIVGFANPETIKSIQTDLVVRSVLEVPCAVTNITYGGGAYISGNFFNTGSGNLNDDVVASFGANRYSVDPAGQLTVSGQTNHNGIYYNVFTLGTVPFGTPITISLSWDQPNHQFVISFTNKVTKVTTTGTMPYTFSDTTPAVGGKSLLVIGSAANCTANRTSNYGDALFSNVYVGQ